jgi:hypothetical protein
MRDRPSTMAGRGRPFGSFTAGAGLGGGLSALALAQGDLDIRVREVVGPEGSGHRQAQAGALLPNAPGTSILMLTATSRGSGLPVLVETIILGPGDMRRVRTVQRFGPEGALVAVYTVREERVIDTVTGAMQVGSRVGKSEPTRSGMPASIPVMRRGGQGQGARSTTGGGISSTADLSTGQSRRASADQELYADMAELAGRDPRVAAMIRSHRARRSGHGGDHGAVSNGHGGGQRQGGGCAYGQSLPGLAYLLGMQEDDEGEELAQLVLDLASLPLEVAITSSNAPAQGEGEGAPTDTGAASGQAMAGTPARA